MLANNYIQISEQTIININYILIKKTIYCGTNTGTCLEVQSTAEAVGTNGLWHFIESKFKIIYR